MLDCPRTCARWFGQSATWPDVIGHLHDRRVGVEHPEVGDGIHREETLSRVISSWAGMSIVTVRRSTLIMRSTKGIRSMRPGPFEHRPGDRAGTPHPARTRAGFAPRRQLPRPEVSRGSLAPPRRQSQVQLPFLGSAYAKRQALYCSTTTASPSFSSSEESQLGRARQRRRPRTPARVGPEQRGPRRHDPPGPVGRCAPECVRRRWPGGPRRASTPR